MFSTSCYYSTSLMLLWVFLIPRHHLVDRMPTKAEEDPSPLSDYTSSDYINYLDDNITSNVLKVADDTNVFRRVNNDDDKQHL